MDRVERLVADQRGDDAFDVAPVAKVGNIAVVPRHSRARRGFAARSFAIALNEVRGVGQGHSAMNEGSVHPPNLTNPPFATADECRQRGVDYIRAIG